MNADRRSAQSEEDGPHVASRRRFLGYLLAAPTLAVGVQLGESTLGMAAAEAAPSVPEISEVADLSDLLMLTARPTANLITVVINKDGTASLAMPRAENGQGVTTMAAMLIAEELDMPVEQVTVEPADARPKLLFNQFTAGTNTAITQFTPIRLAAALAKRSLLEAASIKLGDEVRNLRTRAGRIISKTGSSIPFAELATDAANELTKQVTVSLNDLKPQSEFTIIGKEQRRDDARLAVTGQKVYTTDLDFPKALPTMIARPPTIKGKVEAVNNAEQVRNMPGITDVVTISTDAEPHFGASGQSAVAVRGRTFGQCIDAVRALEITWGPGPVDGESDESILGKLRQAQAPLAVPNPPAALDKLGGALPLVTKNLGRAAGPIEGPVEAIEQEFVFYWRNNAAMEPNVAVADVREDRAEIWSPLQAPIYTQRQIAHELGLPVNKVTVHVTRGGGAFGRRMFSDACLEAVRVSKQIGKPVRYMGHRTDECRAGRAHPMCTSKVRATFNKNLGVLTFEQRHTSVATDYTMGFGEAITATAAKLPFANEVGFSQTIFLLTANVPYDFGGVVLGYNEILTYDSFNTGSHRNLNNPDVRPAQELIVDQIAAKLGKDPLQFRMDNLEDPRTRKVLETVRDEGQWGRSLPNGVAQGEEYKSVTAVIAEVDARPQTANRTIPGATTGPRVRRVTMVVDVGLPINPLGLKAQMEGGIHSAIGQVFTESEHLRDGNFLEGSWDDYRYTRMWNSPPEVNVIVMPANGERVGGAGELGVPAPKAAIACAYARASGTMPTEFPIGHNKGVPFKVKSFEPPIPASPTNGLDFYPAPSAAKGTFNPAQPQ